MADGLFIVGTDRNVGKTMVGVAIVALLREMGVDATMMTPVSTGGSVESAVERLRAIGASEDRSLVTPIAFETPAAPYVAGLVERRPVDIGRIKTAFDKLKSAGKFIVVEGGGAMVPLTARVTTLDLLRDLGLPSIIVGRTGRGTLNHCLLTLRMMLVTGATPLGFVLNGFGQHGDGFAESLNPEVLAELAAPIPVLATLEWRPEYRTHLDKFIRAFGNEQALVAVLKQIAFATTVERES